MVIHGQPQDLGRGIGDGQIWTPVTLCRPSLDAIDAPPAARNRIYARVTAGPCADRSRCRAGIIAPAAGQPVCHLLDVVRSAERPVDTAARRGQRQAAPA